MWATNAQATALAIVASKFLCQPAATAEPCECTFDDPSAWQNFEALRRV
jgi:hypothetical protein